MSKSNSTEMLRKDHYTIGEISRMYHIGADSLRYYEEKGLITPDRSPSGYRLYRDNDIWKLNVIEELRGLGVSVERIRQYLEEGSLESTIQLLKEELTDMDAELDQMQQKRNRMADTIKDLEAAQDLHLHTITLHHFEERHAHVIHQKFSSDEEMDILMKRLSERYGNSFHLIGNNRIAAILSPLYDPQATYCGALLFAEKGPETLPAGDYLSISYTGAWNSRYYARKIMDYAAANNIRLDTQFLDLVWIDIHAAARLEERISEVQVRIRGTYAKTPD